MAKCISLPSHSLPYVALVKKLLLKEELYEPKEEVELGQELDLAIIQKLRHSEHPEEQHTAQLPERGAEEAADGNTDLLHHIAHTNDQILHVLLEIRDLLRAQRL